MRPARILRSPLFFVLALACCRGEGHTDVSDIAAGKKEEVYGDLDLSARSDEAATPDSKAINFGVTPWGDPAKMRVAYQPLAAYLSEKLKSRVRLLIVKTSSMGDVVHALPALTVRTVCEAGNVIVSVADRGSGIGAEDMERIFEPFVTTKAKGLGLGLSICRTIIQAHGGRLWAENRQDGGAVFHFVVPVA